MTSLERLSVAGLMALSAGLGATGAVYLRPFQPPQQAEIVPPPTPDQPLAQARSTVRTVSYFRAHPAELEEKIRICRDNPGEGMHDPECHNAFAS
jgi:hypothetical protein